MSWRGRRQAVGRASLVYSKTRSYLRSTWRTWPLAKAEKVISQSLEIAKANGDVWTEMAAQSEPGDAGSGPTHRFRSGLRFGIGPKEKDFSRCLLLLENRVRQNV